MSNYNLLIISHKDQFMNFYLTICILGLILGLLLQLINMPLVYKFQNYIERVLMLLARISEKEAKLEHIYFLNCCKHLQNRKESFLQRRFIRSDQNDDSLKKKQTVIKVNKSNNNSSYVSNKIQNPRLNTVKNFGLNFISLISVGAYFAIFFVLTS